MKKDIKEFIPVGILDIVGIISIIQILTTNYTFDYRQYIGLILLVICTIIFFMNRKIYKYLIALILILGMINLVSFSTYYIRFGISIIEIQFIPFASFLIYLYIFKKEIRSIIKKSKHAEKESNKNSENMKNHFKHKFEKLSDKEIENRLSQNLVPEAIQALTELQAERK